MTNRDFILEIELDKLPNNHLVDSEDQIATILEETAASIKSSKGRRASDGGIGPGNVFSSTGRIVGYYHVS